TGKGGALGGTGILLLVAAMAAAQEADPPPTADRLYGRVTTTGGDVVEGYLRWDRNEGSWVDLLDGYREIPEENLEEAERLGAASARKRRRSVDFMGVRVSWDEEPEWPDDAEAGLRFGHLRRLRVVGEDEAEVELKSGERILLSGGSTDLGPELRGLEIEAAGGEPIELSWEELEAVEFLSPPPEGATPSATRLHGTVTARRGHRFTGYVSWDLDEILTSDILDGELDGEPVEIPFGDIVSIERLGTRGSRVVLLDGRTLDLRNSNDVDDGHRGVQLSDPGLGQVQIGWREFATIRFHPPDVPVAYDGFDGGRRLRGTVVTEDGGQHRGRIRWDNDEEWSWQILDGRSDGIDYDVELGRVARIRRLEPSGVEVTLRDGRILELRGSNDVNRDNKGIFVVPDAGPTVVVEWADLREVVFEGG
ncbi:MAG TPA: hypothetical protein VLL48_11015, partial [Longimicrobiales bacterium]|nr:hypothetical protein [Longimicrobiales bacterium]